MSPRLTVAALVIVTAVLVYGMLETDTLAGRLTIVREALTPFLEWYYVLTVAFLLIFVVWLGVGRYKNVRLGADDERPEFTFFSWITLLFAAGTGVGLLFWAVAQPVLQFQTNPFIDEGMTPEAAVVAMYLTYFHWGLNGWAIFSFVALVLAYFSFRHGLPLTIRSALHPYWGERVYGWRGDLVDLLAVFGTVFGIATTLGLGVEQLGAGMDTVFGLATTPTIQIAIVAILVAIATISAVSGVQRGVRWLSEGTFWLSLAVAGALLILGPTQYLIGLTIETTGRYLDRLFVLNFHTNVTREDGWQAQWTVFYWGWWLAWSPFVGLFIARVSRGRTIREFVAGVLLAPSLITAVWIGLFGGTALHHELFRDGGIVEAVNANVAIAVFALVDAMQLGGMSQLLSIALIVLIAGYLITSVNAGTLVVTTILAAGDPEPPLAHRILWGAILGVLTAMLLVAGGLEVLQAAVIMAALPFSVVVLLMVSGLLRALHGERFAARTGIRKEAPREPWANVEDAGESPVPAESDDEPMTPEASRP